MGVDVRLNTPVSSLRSLLAQDFDAVFIGSGAPRGKNLDIPGRHDSDRIHIGIDWLESIAFGHIDSIGERVLIIGVGNTAMDCCRSSRRLGGTDIKVMARRPREFFKASPWELDDAEEEGVEILVNHAPKRFVIEDGRLVGMEFERLEWDEQARQSTVVDTVVHPVRRRHPRHRPGERVSLDRARPRPRVRRLGHAGGRPGHDAVDAARASSSAATAAWGPKNIIWAVEHGHQAAISIHNHCEGIPVTERPPQGMNLVSQKMGLTEWSYHNDYNPSPRQKMQHVELTERFQSLGIEVELGFSAEQTAREVQRCLNCDIQTVFPAPLCIECDACIDICPVQCLTITENGDEADLRTRLSAPAEEPRPGALRLRGAAADGAGDGQGRGSLRALRAVRRALPDCRVGHAEVRAPDPACHVDRRFTVAT